MELHFIKGKGSRFDLGLPVSEWKNKVLDTESDEKVCGKWILRRVLCMVRTD